MKIVKTIEAHNLEYRFTLEISEVSENQFYGDITVLTNSSAVILDPGIKPPLIRGVKNEQVTGKSIDEVQKICEKRMREFEGGELIIDIS